MTLRSRLAALERRQPATEGVKYLDEEGLVEWYAEHADLFANEPDFPTALALAREAVDRAKLSTEPPWIPPEEPRRIPPPHNSLMMQWYLYRSRWFPEASRAVGWLNEMDRRREHGVPPVSEAEYIELAAWFLANEKRLDAIADTLASPNLLDVGKIGDSWHRTRVRGWMVRYGLREDGPRGERSGETAETIRRLQVMYPD